MFKVNSFYIRNYNESQAWLVKGDLDVGYAYTDWLNHDIIDINNPEKALQKIKQSYFTELIVKDLSLVAKELPAPLHDLNVHLVMNGKKATLNQFELLMGNSDLSITGFISDLPAIMHHTSIPVKAHFDIASKYLDIYKKVLNNQSLKNK